MRSHVIFCASSSGCAPRRRQQGIVLFVALILLLIVTVLGVTLARMQTSEERMAQNEDNRQIAFQAAEAALNAAMTDLRTGVYADANGDFLCQPANKPGLYMAACETSMLGPAGTSIVAGLNWNNPGNPGVVTLTYDGAALNALQLAQQPQFIIEEMAQEACPYSNTGSSTYVYRVTAHAWGADATSGVTLQSVVRPGC